MAVGDKARLAVRIWWSSLVVRSALARMPLGDVVTHLDRVRPSAAQRPPAQLGRTVVRALYIGPHRPRCLVLALVLYRLLREQGESPELVIGLPNDAAGSDAHAWVEIRGADVGPPPGRRGHLELARYS
jgi:transglutaminase superfamily protein